MDDRQPDQVDRVIAERLLTGARDVPADVDALARLLTAAAAPGRPAELAGESAALAAFRQAQRAGAHQRRRPSWRSVAVKLLGFKALVALLAAGTAGGLALAAGGGGLPNPFHPAPPAVTGSPRPPTPTPSGTPPRATPSRPAAVPTPSAPAGGFAGLCTAYLAKDQAERVRWLRTPAAARLVEAAGGADKVDTFCGDPHPGNSRGGGPPDDSHPAHPTGPPESRGGR